MKKFNQRTNFNIILVFSQQDCPMIGHSDIEFGEISPSPRPLPLPLFCAQISHSQYTQKRHQKVLVQRITNKTYIPIPHHSEELSWVDAIQCAVFRHPFPRIDRVHFLPLVPEAIPGVAVERAGLVVEGLCGFGVLNPSAIEEIARQQCG